MAANYDELKLNYTTVQNVSAVVNTYSNAVRGEYQSLESLIASLTSQYFIGEAAEGFKEFFTKNVVPAMTENLTDGESCLMKSIETIVNSCYEHLCGKVDPALADNNRNPGQEG